jgi:hypothetical protein
MVYKIHLLLKFTVPRDNVIIIKTKVFTILRSAFGFLDP